MTLQIEQLSLSTKELVKISFNEALEQATNEIDQEYPQKEIEVEFQCEKTRVGGIVLIGVYTQTEYSDFPECEFEVVSDTEILGADGVMENQEGSYTEVNIYSIIK